MLAIIINLQKIVKYLKGVVNQVYRHKINHIREQAR